MTSLESHGIGPPPDLTEIVDWLDGPDGPDPDRCVADDPYCAVVTRARRIAARLEKAS